MASYCPLVTMKNEPQEAHQAQTQQQRIKTSKGSEETTTFQPRTHVCDCIMEERRQESHLMPLNYLLTFSLQKYLHISWSSE